MTAPDNPFREMIEAITGDDWLAALERASLERAEAKCYPSPNKNGGL